MLHRFVDLGSDDTVSGGASRSAVAVTALVTRPASQRGDVDRLGIDARAQLDGEQQTLHRGRSTTPRQRAERSGEFGTAVARPVRGASMRRISSMTALTAAVAMAVPL